MTSAQEAVVALLALPDPPDLRTSEGAGRGFRRTVDGKADRFDLLVSQASVYRTWKLVDARTNDCSNGEPPTCIKRGITVSAWSRTCRNWSGSRR